MFDFISIKTREKNMKHFFQEINHVENFFLHFHAWKTFCIIFTRGYFDIIYECGKQNKLILYQLKHVKNMENFFKAIYHVKNWFFYSFLHSENS